MRTIGTAGEYTLIEIDRCVGTMDKEGKIIISPDLGYRSIQGFNKGRAIANRLSEDNQNLVWGLIDENGEPRGDFKYTFIEPWGEGFYKCEIGNKKNILRRDGTEVLKVWFDTVSHVKERVFVIGNTIRKTKDHPTLYPYGLASVTGDILIPLIFDSLQWKKDIFNPFLYGKIKEKAYLVLLNGSIIDPEGGHLPDIYFGQTDSFNWKGPKHTVCDGCIFTDGINERGEGCRKLNKEQFRQAVYEGVCKHYKQDEFEQSVQDKLDEYQEKQTREKEAKQSDEFAINLVKDFIRDVLNGNVSKLASFDFTRLRSDTKFGDCGGYAFSPAKTSIMKAIMSLVSKDVWPEISYDSFDVYGVEAAPINTYAMLLGVPIGNNFKGLREFRPSAELLDRACAFYRLTNTIGNYMVVPGGTTLARERVRRDQRYIDSFLQAFLFAINNPKKGSLDILGVINHQKKIFAPYRSEEGFISLCRKLYLDDYLDENGKPKSMFYGVWSDQKGLTREQYVEAVEQYFNVCEPIITRRSEKIVQKLKEVISLDSIIIPEEDTIVLQVQEQFTKLKSLPEDPENAVSYGKDSKDAVCFLQTYPITYAELMPMTDVQPIIDGIHNSLADNQGLIEVECGKTTYEKHFVYSIIKNLNKPSGITYILTMHIIRKGKALCVKGQFEERGETGKRETMIYEVARKKDLIKSISEGWSCDPYDKNFTRGVLMNLSEQREYDSYFFTHPLTEMRRLIKYIIENN